METDTILWRRLDAAGHDACRLVRKVDAWRLEGMAVFRHGRVPACLVYEIGCDGGWRTLDGLVHGWMGDRPVDYRVTRKPNGIWTLNGQIIPGLDGCINLDLGFTPATNLLQLQHAALQIGQAADVPVAWLDVDRGTLSTLHQRYERRTVEGYWYEAPRFGYFALLQVNTNGFVEKYPNLWEAEP
ncbi:MAG: putative glycolipid-binding domain-containing protein [Desulfobulbaceae bacterium]|nr:putative glycolipid-binding domain-containing protein [Desulfobulbaceae bacterium]